MARVVAGARLVPAPGALRPLSPQALLWRRLRRTRSAAIGAVVVGILALAAVAAPWLAPHDPIRNDLSRTLAPPGAPGHLLGTDNLGRDILSRIIFGSRISLTVGLVVQSAAVGIGTVLGLLAGYYGGWLDDGVSGLTNIMFAFPRFLFALAIMAVLGASLYNVFIALGVVGWPTICRLVRGEVLALKAEDFVEAARANGASDVRIMVRHILPNTLGPIIVAATLGVAGAILAEASLSFLGLGAQPPAPSWGSMLSRGRAYIWSAPWMTFFPGLAIFVAILGLNLLGDGLRDVLDPRIRH
ncbi:MAG: ABC transporter permease [Armatimonadota bacterium]|nr:ABC transporter permease [Armatimonadota bacterium]MDR7533169.1 ABC transporter permease [Armatimonadota bacterium]MDR7536917.1 ABC transporter permease [Armatimonadota bacterium]